MKKKQGSSSSGILRQVLASAMSVAMAIAPFVAAPSSMTAAPLSPDHNDRNVVSSEWNPKNHDDNGGDRDHDFDDRGRDHDRDSNGGCDLESSRREIKHVIYIQFDNVHFERNNPNVPSDLEQMPNLLNFMKNNGVLLTNSHTPLISHTADDIITSLTGVYPDRHGDAVANSFGYFPQNSTAADLFSSSFAYWSDPVSTATPPTDPSYVLVTANGKNAPAPWVPYTRAGCNVGAVSIANMELENITSDITTIFSPTSPQFIEAQTANACTPFSSATCAALRNQAVADFEGIAIHCAAGNSLCSTTKGGASDVLPQEPGGYSGFDALYGHKSVVPNINGSGGTNANLLDLNGNLITDATSAHNVGFPGFGGISAYQTLSYVAAMQENGVPVTFAYIADVHDNSKNANAHPPADCVTDPNGGLGPGDICYEEQIAAYNDAFGKFFARLAADGINSSNALFLITTDEQDHFAGAGPTPSTCDGVTIHCTYTHLGEVDSNLTNLLNGVDPGLTTKEPYDIHFDMAPTFYLKGNPAPNAAITREYERSTGKLTGVSPISGATDNLTVAMADPVEMKLLHMITGDPQRTPSFVMFGDPDYFFQTSGTPTLSENAAFSWNHGGIQPEITTTWVGLVGPGIEQKGEDDTTFADETDYRPTMLSLAGLKDDYSHEGRLLVEEFLPWAVPDGVSDSKDEFLELANAYNQINAPLGDLAKNSLKISTFALNGNDLSDATYANLENALASITAARDTLATQMEILLENAEFCGKPIKEKDEKPLTKGANALLEYVQNLAGSL